LIDAASLNKLYDLDRQSVGSDWWYSATREEAALLLANLMDGVARGRSLVFSGDMPEDFTFLLRYGVGARNELDTGAGTFTKDLISAGMATVALALTPEELQEVWQELVRLKPSFYPETFAPVDTGTQMWHTPSIEYDLVVRLGGREIHLYWDDSSGAARPEAVSLRTLFGRIQTMIEVKPAYQALPPASGGYA
jgi:hypothetical protein